MDVKIVSIGGLAHPKTSSRSNGKQTASGPLPGYACETCQMRTWSQPVRSNEQSPSCVASVVPNSLAVHWIQVTHDLTLFCCLQLGGGTRRYFPSTLYPLQGRGVGSLFWGAIAKLHFRTVSQSVATPSLIEPRFHHRSATVPHNYLRNVRSSSGLTAFQMN